MAFNLLILCITMILCGLMLKGKLQANSVQKQLIGLSVGRALGALLYDYTMLAGFRIQ